MNTILCFLISAISIKMASLIIGGPINYPCIVELTNSSSKPETVSVAIILGAEESKYNMSVSETYVWLEKIPEIRSKARYGYKDFRSDASQVARLGGAGFATNEKWVNKYVDIITGDTLDCDSGCYWCEKYGVKCGELLDEYTLGVDNVLLRKVPYIEYYAGWVDIGEQEIPLLERIDRRISLIDSLALDVSKVSKTTAINKIRQNKSLSGKKFKQRKVVSSKEVTRGGLDNLVVPANQTVKLKIVFRTEFGMRSQEIIDGKVVDIGGSHGIEIRGKSTGELLYKKIYNTWKSGWNYCHPVVISTDSLSGENLTNFPMMVRWKAKVTDASHFVGRIYTDYAGTSDWWAETEGDSIDWVKVLTINENGDSFKVWGKSSGGLSKDSSEMVWDTANGYLGVYHLHETSGNYFDGTSNADSGIASGGLSRVDGKIGKAIDLDGTNGMVEFDEDKYEIQDYTIECWFNSDGVSGNYEAMFSCAGIRMASAIKFTTERFANVMAGGSANSLVSSDSAEDNTWYYMVIRRDITKNDTAWIYINGQIDTLDRKKEDWVTYSPANIYTRLGYGWTNYFDGTIDEFRVSNGQTSSEWIKMQYLSMIDDLLTFGAEEKPPKHQISGVAGGNDNRSDSAGIIVYIDSLTSGFCDTTASNGAYDLGNQIDAGTYTIYFDALNGYNDFDTTMTISTDTTLNVTLKQSAILTVTERRSLGIYKEGPDSNIQCHIGGNAKCDTIWTNKFYPDTIGYCTDKDTLETATYSNDTLAITEHNRVGTLKVKIDTVALADSSLQSNIGTADHSDSSDVSANTYTLQTKDTTDIKGWDDVVLGKIRDTAIVVGEVKWNYTYAESCLYADTCGYITSSGIGDMVFGIANFTPNSTVDTVAISGLRVDTSVVSVSIRYETGAWSPSALGFAVEIDTLLVRRAVADTSMYSVWHYWVVK